MIYEQQWLTTAQRQALADARTFPRADEQPEPSVVSRPSLTLSPQMEAAMARVTVQSLAYRVVSGITPANDVQAAKIAAIIARGPTYETLACFQGWSA